MVEELGAKGPKAGAEPLPVKPAWMVPDDDDSPPSKVVLHQRSSLIKGRLQAKSSSIKGGWEVNSLSLYNPTYEI